jgi:predicted nucleic acid-binding protein
MRVAALDRDVAGALSDVPRDAVPDMPDRIIAATAVTLGLPLVTRDGKIAQSGVQTVWQPLPRGAWRCQSLRS